MLMTNLIVMNWTQEDSGAIWYSVVWHTQWLWGK